MTKQNCIITAYILLTNQAS